jgi:perosamine synthetase
MKYREAYIQRISDWLSVQPGQIELYWKGRVGLYALLKAFGVKAGDEVILPAFTCVVVPNAIIYCGAKPIYVDISPKTLNTTLAHIKEAITEKTKVIMVQNTFGLSNEVDEISAYAKSKGILTIEDCTHGFGGTFKDAPNGSYCDAAFYSTQWNKPFSTGIGGFAVLNNAAFAKDFQKVNSQLATPSRKDRYVLASLIQAKKYLLHDSTYWAALRLYRSLSKSGLVVGSSKGEELVDTKMPKNYFLRAVKVQEKVGEKALLHLAQALENRQQNGMQYNQFLKALGKWHYAEEDLLNHSFLNFPIFVKDKKAFQAAAEKAKIRLGDWFVSPIHPVMENFEKWHLQPNDFPVAVEKSNHILNLPTEPSNIQQVLDFLKNQADNLL